MSQQPLTIEVVEPNGGERLQPGQQFDIRWRSTGAVSHTVKLSTNGGADYTDISPQLSGAKQSFRWTVPQFETSRARIRVAVRDTSDNRLTDDSNDDFSISVLTAPAPVTNAVFTKALGRVLHRPTVLPVPKFGPTLLLGGELAESLLYEGQRVLPDVLLDAGFEFQHTDLETVLRELLA